MEATEEIQLTLEQKQSIEENLDKQDDTKREDKVTRMFEATDIQDDTIEERHQSETEAEVDVKTAKEGEKVGEKSENQTVSPKISKRSSKQISKAKVTVPRPFSLATDKRMSRERRGSMDFKDSKPILSKSASLNCKNMSRSSLGPETNSELRRGSSTRPPAKTSLRPKVPKGTDMQVDRNVKIPLQLKSQKGPTSKDDVRVKLEVEKKKPQVIAKKQEGNHIDSNKLGQSFSFKALPLPRFYQQKDIPSTVAAKKIPKAPSDGQQGENVAKSESKRNQEKCKKVSKTISSGAKETISKLLRATRGSLSTSKHVTRGVVLSA